VLYSKRHSRPTTDGSRKWIIRFLLSFIVGRLFNLPTSAHAAILLDSSWDTSTGNSDSALRDGGKWTWQEDFGAGKLLTVVSGGPSGHNMLRVQQRGSSFAANVQINDFIALSKDFYVRYYMKNDDTSSSGDHIVTVDTYHYDNLTFMRKYGGATNWRMVVSVYGCGYVYPIGHWSPSPMLANGQWYRFEYFVHYVDATHIQVHPRVYDAAGNLVLSDADFQQSDPGQASWGGRSDWTLASYYAGGNNFCVDPSASAQHGGHNMTDFGLGNNGQQGAADTGQFWYFAGVQLRDDTWAGPLGGGGSTDTTAPSAPGGLTAMAASASQINLSWTAATDNIGVTGYKVYGCLAAACTPTLITTLGNVTSYSNTGLTASSLYRYQVSAIDAANNESAKSGMASTTTLAASVPPSGGIAAHYPGDVGIENDPNVLFVEKFNEASVATMQARYQDVLGPSNMSFSSDVPAGSADTHSVSIAGGGRSSGGHLYKQLTPGVDDTLYVRFYVKYPTSGAFTHSGVWMGGYNPPLAFPNPQAGVRPTGSERFSASGEQDSSGFSRFDHYDYWMGMRPDGTGTYWGNTLLNNPSVQATAGQWTCVEHMVKLNNPVTALNGEHAIWINGASVSHLGLNFPNGTWSGGNFTQSTSGSPFPGFQWRNTTALNLNYIWLQNYAPTAPYATILYDNLVVAKSYIGCITPAGSLPSGSACDLNNDASINVGDVQQCVNQAIGRATCATGDINKDGSCTVVDVQRDVNAALGGQCVTQ
jgi:hypothetical protein